MPSNWTRVVIESPYAGDVFANAAFARNVCRWAVERGYSPYASHLFFTQFLDDAKPDERTAGMQAGFAWGALAEEVWFCLPDGKALSSGMQDGREWYAAAGLVCRVMHFSEDGRHLLAREAA